MQQIVECVPNFSNGRDPEVYEAIASAIAAVSGVQMLNVSADPDHNRTVITFVGSPEAVSEAAFQGIAKASQLIDLDTHQGEHPRLGATDVCPFIPVRGVTMDECVQLAQTLGQRVGEELGIAVYLYGAAASQPERVSLSKIRKGEYEAWKEEVATVPERQPDYGPAEPKSWGATVIGARPFLIAYNLYLNTDDVDVAEEISRAIRHSSGGLRYVQAKGFLVEGQAQVSMNLTDFTKTPIHTVQELVRREAAQRGCTVTRAELVGLIPEQALIDSARWYLQLSDMEREQILEFNLITEQDSAETEEAAATKGAETFINAVAAPTVAPGGGAVAAVAGSLSAALAEMVAGLTAGRKKYATVEERAQAVLANSSQLRAELSAAVAADIAAFDGVMAIIRDKTLSAEAKDAALEAAYVRASEVPLGVARLSRDAAYLAQEIAAIGNVNAASDAAAGAIIARAAVQIAALNVQINAASISDSDLTAGWQEELDALQEEVESIAVETVRTARERGGF